MIETIQTDSPKVISVKLSGKLHHEDYKSFVPTVETILAAQGKVQESRAGKDFFSSPQTELARQYLEGLAKYR